MTLALRHRGPDEQKWNSPFAGVWFGHARLKVIDLTESGSQPMTRRGQPGALVFNGEIYNYRELRTELEAMGETFLGSSDSEVLLAAYQAWGPNCLDRLRGMFAFAVWDAARRRVFLARDRAGKKPLFYLHRPGLFAFASEIKALSSLPKAPTEIRSESLPSLVAFGYPPSGESCWRGIRQLPPGSWGAYGVAGGSWEKGNFWRPRWRPAARPPSFAQAARETRRLLEKAVEKRLVSDVPLGAFLSGGLDSTIVTGLMSRLLGAGKVQTFSIGFENEPAFDESSFAREASEFHGTQHTVFRVQPPAFSLVEKLVHFYDGPFADSSAIPTYLVAELARRHVTVVLTGDGGDEIFAGYPRMAAAVMTERIPAWLRQAGSAILKGLVDLMKPGTHTRSRREYLRRLAEALGDPLPDRYLRWISVWNRPGEILKNHVTPKVRLSNLDPEAQKTWTETAGQALLGRILEINYREYLGNDLLVKVDRCTMAHGLEARCPFLDQDLFEFCASLPVSYHLRGLNGKNLLRAACDDLLPPRVRQRGKMGFGIPLGSWFRGAWRKPLETRLRSPAALLYRYIDFERVQACLDDHLQGRRDQGQRLWLLLTMEVWLQNQGAGQTDVS